MHCQQNSAAPYRSGPSDLWWRDLSSSMVDVHRPQLRSTYQVPRDQFSLQGCDNGKPGSQASRLSCHVTPSAEGRWNIVAAKGSKWNRHERPRQGEDCASNSHWQSSWTQNFDNESRSTTNFSAFKNTRLNSRSSNGRKRFITRTPNNGPVNGFWRPQQGEPRMNQGDWIMSVNSRSSLDKSNRKGASRGENLPGRTLREWTVEEGLKDWLWSPDKFSFGSGHLTIVLERDAEPGVWKVSPAFGCRFSRCWLEGISEWVSFFRQAKNGHNSRKQKNSYCAFIPVGATHQSGVDPTNSNLYSQASTTENQVERPSGSAESVIDGNPSASSSPELCAAPPSLDSCQNLASSSSLGLLSSSPEESIEAVESSSPAPKIWNAAVECESPSKSDAVGMIPVPVSQDADDRPPTTPTVGKNLLDSDLISISVRCEKMGITDMEAEMLVAWLEEHKDSVNCAKLWLFDNKLTDQGAKSVTKAMHDGLMELHLSHNTITNAGAELVISSISTNRTAGKPLWLRMEWNMLNVDSLMTFLKQQGEERGLVIDIPKFKLKKVKGRTSSQLMHDKTDSHVQIPWIRSQRLKPSEAPVLMAAKSSWIKSRAIGTCAPMDSHDFVAPSGPMLIFPDTSALLGLIGISRKGQRSAALTFEWLQNLCLNGAFGKSLPANERVYFILCDSVAKQLDGLKKQNPYVAQDVVFTGDDFVTVLGAHEGEGMVVDRNAEVLDSRSHNVHDKGQATDLKIIEVALFFQQELCRRTLGPQGSPESSEDRDALPDAHSPGRFPVVLLSNDNVQLVAAKSHGLPAFRFTDFSKFRHLRSTYEKNRPLTASAMRVMMEGWATRGLGESAKKSLQGEFDGAVACIKHLLESYEGVQGRFHRVKELLRSDSNCGSVLEQLRTVMGVESTDTSDNNATSNSNPSPRDDCLDEVTNNEESSCCVSSSVCSVSSDIEDGIACAGASEESGGALSVSFGASEEGVGLLGEPGDMDGCEAMETELVSLVRVKLSEWEGLVKSYQNPSRVLR